MLIALVDTWQPGWNPIADFLFLLHYHFMQNAYIAGTLVAGSAGLMGYFMVLRNQSFAGHSLANVGFAGATGAALFGIPPIIGLFVAGLLAAVGIQMLNQASRQSRQSDIAVGAVFTASLALGFLFTYLSTQYAASVYNVLFGNALGISDADVRLIVWSTLALMVILALIARPLFFASLDPDVATARGVPVRMLSLGYLVLLALVVAVAVQVVGVLLIFALLVTPAAIAHTVTAKPLVAALIAVALAFSFTWLGLAAGFFTPYPVSFFITTFAFGTYVLVRAARLLRTRARRQRQESLPLAHKGGAA